MTAKCVTIEEAEIQIIQKAIKHITGTVGISVIKNKLDIHLYSPQNGIVSIENLKVKNDGHSDFKISVGFNEFCKTLDRTSLGPKSLKLTLDNTTNSLKVKIGKMTANLPVNSYDSIDSRIDRKETIEIGEFSVSSLHKLKTGLKPLCIGNTSKVVISEDTVISLDILKRTLIYYTTLDLPFKSKVKTKSNKEISTILGFSIEQFNFLQNSALSIFSKISDTDKIKVYAVCVNNIVTMIQATIDSKTAKFDIYARLLDELEYIKALQVIPHCKSFKKDYNFLVKALDLALSVGSSDILSLDYIGFSNEKNTKKMSVISEFGNFTDEVDIESNVKFKLFTFTDYIKSILSESAGPVDVKISLNASMPIICIDCSPNTYFVSCLNTTTLPYKVGEVEKSTCLAQK